MARWCMVAAATLMTAGEPASSQVIKLGSLAPEGSPYHQGLVEIAQAWKKMSNGGVDVRIFPGGVVGDEPDMIRKMRIGQLNAAALTSVSLITIAPDIEAISFPSMVQTDEELDEVIRVVGPQLEQQLQERGFVLVAWTLAGWVHFFAREPVIAPADLQRQKLFFWGSDTRYLELLKRTRFHPVSLPVAELLPSLQSGLVEAFAAPPAVALAFQWHPRAPHMTAMRWQPLPGCVVVDQRTWNRIPEALRPGLLAEARRISGSLMARSRQLEIDAIAAMKQAGLTVHDVPDTVREEWMDLVRREGYPIFVGSRFSREIFEAVQAAVAPLRQSAPVE
ncbi:MAG TPA: TRAP transporter substrate-binding protein DctP [Kiritimatiellia bacterium]|mgnify:CR=1 FL=1|nr:TRAP transporter substrate-binding protein DctP [Kiritimatiellia bacterium]HMO97729.1 TRAP transporter substrate-binding protein DctP [Kiritimatiellia bacterium]